MNTLSYVIIAIGIFVLGSTFFETKKQHSEIKDMAKLHKCKELTYYSKPIGILALMILPCLICAYSGFASSNETMLNLGILLSFLFLSETYRSYFVLRIYYNDEGVIANDQFLRIKSVKTYYQNSKLPFSKWTFMTYRNDKIIIVAKLAKFITEHYAQELPVKKQVAK